MLISSKLRLHPLEHDLSSAAPARDRFFRATLLYEWPPRKRRRSLSSHRRLFRTLRWWTLRLVVPRFLASSQARYEHAVADLFAPPVALRVADEFRWYCSQRQALEQPNVALAEQVRPRYEQARRAFAAPRFADAYRRWRRREMPSTMTCSRPSSGRRGNGAMSVWSSTFFPTVT